MADKTEEQRLEVLSNVRVTRKHFEDAMKKIKSSLDKHAIQEYDKKAWKVLYSAEENSVLEKGASAVMRLSYGSETEEKTKLKDELEKAVYSVTKDFDNIADLTRKAEYILKDEQ
jgi:transitional endoplasmic reticulum ATPase